MKMHWVAFVAAWFMLTSSVAAEAAPDPAGLWAIRSEGRVLALVTVKREAQASTVWDVDFVCPSGTVFSLSHMASGMTPMIEHRRLRSTPSAGGVIRLKYVDPKPDQARDVVLLTPVADGYATWTIEGASFEPILMVRAHPGEKVGGEWTQGAEHALDEPWPSNAEMTRLFDEDQAARQSTHIDWDVVTPQDAARRVRTQGLLHAGALHSGDDYWHAAFVFQHGDKPEDYLLAHGLAVIAAAKGRRDAPWIAAATLDRYLQSVGQQQIYGTQYHLRPGTPATQEPYDRATISDVMRIATGVPVIADQEKRRAEFDARPPSSAAPPKP
jgi:hypothetical protein